MRRLAVCAIVSACGAQLHDPRVTTDASSHSGDAPSSTAPDAPSGDAPACFNGRVVFLEFGGVTLAKGPSDATTNHAVWMGVTQATIPPYHNGNTNRASDIADITAKITATLSQFPITVVTTRPAAGPYVMIAFGGDANLVGVPYIDSVAHLDCGDATKSDVGLVFDVVSPQTNQKTADFAIGAIAFGLGLTGTGDPSDCMCGWLNGCNQNAGPCTLSSSITADLRCGGQTNPQNEVAAFQAAFCR